MHTHSGVYVSMRNVNIFFSIDRLAKRASPYSGVATLPSRFAVYYPHFKHISLNIAVRDAEPALTDPYSWLEKR